MAACESHSRSHPPTYLIVFTTLEFVCSVMGGAQLVGVSFLDRSLGMRLPSKARAILVSSCTCLSILSDVT